MNAICFINYKNGIKCELDHLSSIIGLKVRKKSNCRNNLTLVLSHSGRVLPKETLWVGHEK